MSKLKGPLILTLVVIVVRIILEEMGAPGAFTNILGVFWLAIIFAIYFAIGLAASEEAHPYKTLIKLIIGYGVGARLMVAISYSLAYGFQLECSPLRRAGQRRGNGSAGPAAGSALQFCAGVDLDSRPQSGGRTCYAGYPAKDGAAVGCPSS